MIPVLWLQVLLDNLKYFNILLVHGDSSAHPSGFLRESLHALTFCPPHIFPNLPFTLFMLWWLNGKPMAATAGAQQAAAEPSTMLAHTTHLSLSPPTVSDRQQVMQVMNTQTGRRGPCRQFLGWEVPPSPLLSLCHFLNRTGKAQPWLLFQTVRLNPYATNTTEQYQLCSLTVGLISMFKEAHMTI